MSEVTAAIPKGLFHQTHTQEMDGSLSNINYGETQATALRNEDKHKKQTIRVPISYDYLQSMNTPFVASPPSYSGFGIEGDRSLPHALKSSREDQSMVLQKKKVSKACTQCQSAHAACGLGRPCQRCIERCYPEKCIDSCSQKRGRKVKAIAQNDLVDMSSTIYDNSNSTPTSYTDSSPSSPLSSTTSPLSRSIGSLDPNSSYGGLALPPDVISLVYSLVGTINKLVEATNKIQEEQQHLKTIVSIITGQNQAESKLSNSNRITEPVCPLLVLRRTEDVEIIMFNRQFYEALELTRQEMIGVKWQDLLAVSLNPDSHHCMLKTKNGVLVLVSIAWKKVPDALNLNNQTLGVVKITKMERVESDVIQTNEESLWVKKGENSEHILRFLLC